MAGRCTAKMEPGDRGERPAASARSAICGAVPTAGGAVRLGRGGPRPALVALPQRLPGGVRGDHDDLFPRPLGSVGALQPRAAAGGLGARAVGRQHRGRAGVARAGAARRVVRQDRHRAPRGEPAAHAPGLGRPGGHAAGGHRLAGHLRGDLCHRRETRPRSAPGGHARDRRRGVRGVGGHCRRRRGRCQETGCVGGHFAGGGVGHRDDFRAAADFPLPRPVHRGRRGPGSAPPNLPMPPASRPRRPMAATPATCRGFQAPRTPPWPPLP